jgi:hypothetical protein
MANKVELAGAGGADNSSSAPIYTSNALFGASASFTPTAASYTAGDVYDVAQTFAGIGPTAGGTVRIVSTTLLIAHTALVASEGAYTLHLFNAALASPLADNAAFDVAVADRTKYLGSLALGTPVDVGTSLWVEVNSLNKLITVPSGGAVIGYLVNAATITPTAAARTVRLHAVQV